MMPSPTLTIHLPVTLLLRTLRLNCLTDAYADLWRELYDPSLAAEGWVCDWPRLSALGDVGSDWEWDTPLRTEYARRAALVEIDALVAVWLGIRDRRVPRRLRVPVPGPRRLRGRHVVRRQRPEARGDYNRTVTGRPRSTGSSSRTTWRIPATNPPPDGYTPPFYKADRIAEYRQAHAVFSERLRKAREEGGMR